MDLQITEFEIYHVSKDNLGKTIMTIVEKKSRDMYWLINPVIDEKGRLMAVESVQSLKSVILSKSKEVKKK